MKRSLAAADVRRCAENRFTALVAGALCGCALIACGGSAARSPLASAPATQAAVSATAVLGVATSAPPPANVVRRTPVVPLVLTPHPVPPTTTPEPAQPGVARTVAPGPTPPPGGLLAVSLALNEDVCGSGSITLLVTVRSAEGRPVRGALLSGEVALQGGSRSLRLGPTDVAGKSSTSVDIGRPSAGYTIEWTVQAQAGQAAGAGSILCQSTP